MTHEEQRIWLIRQLLEEEEEYKDYQIPGNEQDQKNLLRALMNVRLPKEIGEEFLKIQDEYLAEENRQAPITDVDGLTPCAVDSRLYLWQGDITRLKVDAIVNAANNGMTGCYQPLHNCIDNCIHTYAGMQLRSECSRQMMHLRIKYGKEYKQPTAVPMLTDAYNLSAKKVIHIVGPIVYYKLTPGLEEKLADCYRNTLDMCLDNGLKSVAFCCISTGIFRFPNQRAAEIAVETVRNWLAETGSDMKVIFNVFKDLDLEIYSSLLKEEQS